MSWGVIKWITELVLSIHIYIYIYICIYAYIYMQGPGAGPWSRALEQGPGPECSRALEQGAPGPWSRALEQGPGAGPWSRVPQGTCGMCPSNIYTYKKRKESEEMQGGVPATGYPGQGPWARAL